LSPTSLRPILLVAVAGVVLSACGDGAVTVRAPEGKPWVKDNDCSWWLSGADGKSHRASITQGDDGLVLSVSDPAFTTWSDEDRPLVELRFNKDPKRQATAEGWVTHGGEGPSMFGLFLSEAALKAMADATTFELRRDGTLIVELPLVDTPNQADLEACVPPPNDGRSDSE